MLQQAHFIFAQWCMYALRNSIQAFAGVYGTSVLPMYSLLCQIGAWPHCGAFVCLRASKAGCASGPPQVLTAGPPRLLRLGKSSGTFCLGACGQTMYVIWMEMVPRSRGLDSIHLGQPRRPERGYRSHLGSDDTGDGSIEYAVGNGLQSAQCRPVYPHRPQRPCPCSETGGRGTAACAVEARHTPCAPG